MATREDAEAGWERYREAGYALSLDEINSSLLAAGRSPIAPRTYNHYKKLRKYGYESYLPINQLDVKTLADPIWDQATRSRFLPMSIQEQVEVRFLSDDTVSELTGLATELSEGETTVKLKVGAEALPRTLASKEPIVEVVFRNGGEIRIGTVSRFWVEGKQELVVLKVQFSDPANIEAITNKPSAKRIRVRVQLGNPQDVRQFRELMQTLYWLFQTLESSRSFANEVLLTIDREPAVIIPAPQIFHHEHPESPNHGDNPGGADSGNVHHTCRPGVGVAKQMARRDTEEVRGKGQQGNRLTFGVGAPSARGRPIARYRGSCGGTPGSHVG